MKKLKSPARPESVVSVYSEEITRLEKKVRKLERKVRHLSVINKYLNEFSSRFL